MPNSNFLFHEEIGEKGDNATITIGSVTKGTDPAVTNSGTATSMLF